MNAERWERLQVLIEETLALPAKARPAHLDTACAGDGELRAEALSLIAAAERSPDSPTPPDAWLRVLTGPAPPRFQEGDHLARRYRVRRLLGRGGMGEVYEVWDEELSILVALKVIPLSSGTPETYKRLKLEGLLARSVWHPNVCRFFDLGRHDDHDATWFLTMELLQGETLANRMRDQGRLPLDHAQRYLEQIAAGLGAAHRAGVVHRDLKPANIMLVGGEAGEHAVVTDFGIARATSQAASSNDFTPGSGSIIGTPTYMSPEQVRGEEVGPATDIYSLGVVLYEMATGTVPFTGQSALEIARRRLSEDPPAPRRLVPELDRRWESVILRCLAREPHRRFARAEEVAEALCGRASVEPVESIAIATGTWHSMPAEHDPFVGREQDQRELERSLSGSTRLVTLVGAGGMGKTRLALHHGRRQVEGWRGGVWFCDLTDTRSANGIASVVAGALGVELGGGDPVEQLGHAIVGRGRCLLILDNAEQVRAELAAIVARWLARTTDARFLVTSRERLGLGDEEQVQAVGPLSMETGLALLATRVLRLRPGFALDGAELEAAREIVRLVDGMPLAIELAVARMRVMSATQIVGQMRKRFSLLTGGVTSRHETLVMTIDGSWELLKPWERSAWAQCAVFEGGFTLEAAEAVIDLSAWPEAPWLVDVVQLLVEKSLLRTWVPPTWRGMDLPEARFGMFASLQEYARLKLREGGAVPPAVADIPTLRATEERHGRWFARCGEVRAIHALKEHGGPRLRRRVERELDNLVAACRRAVERGDASIAVPAYRGSWAVLELRGPFGVAVEMGQGVLRNLSLTRVEEALVVRTLGQAEWYAGMVQESRAHLELALAIAREISDRHGEGLTLGNLGGMEVTQGEMEKGSADLEQALEIAREIVDPFLECNILNSLSIALRGQGRMAEAGSWSEAALALARSVGDRQLEGTVLTNRGLLQQDQGRTAEARAHYEAALEIHREVGCRRLEGSTHGNLGGLNYDQGLFADARTHLEAALLILRETGSRFSEGIALINLGSLNHTEGRLEEALAQLESALAIERELGNRRLEGAVLGALGRLHQDRGEGERAGADYRSALAFHREADDRRAEGVTLAYQASLFHEQGSIDSARDVLGLGEKLLRELNAHLDLAQLLCVRAEVEHASGATPTALLALNEAEELASRLESGPDSELGRMLTRARALLSAIDGR